MTLDLSFGSETSRLRTHKKAFEAKEKLV